MSTRRTLYEDLGISPGATPGRIKLAYETKLTELKGEDGPLAQRERDSLARAFATLSDPDKRDQYHRVIGIPAYEPVVVAAKKSATGGVPLWLVGGAVAIVVLVSLPFIYKPESTVIVAPPPAASSQGDPTAPEIRPVAEAQPSAPSGYGNTYDEKVRREFDAARRNFENQQQRDAYNAQRNAQMERYREEQEKRKATYEAQREQFQREQERRDLERRQREEVDRANRQLRDLQQR
jgi:curved DNA-binding protein CbpA